MILMTPFGLRLRLRIEADADYFPPDAVCQGPGDYPNPEPPVAMPNPLRLSAAESITPPGEISAKLESEL